MDVTKHYIHIINRKHFKSGGTTYLKKAKTSAKNLKIATKNHRKVQSKRTQQSDGVITTAGNKQKLRKAARKKLWAHQKSILKEGSNQMESYQSLETNKS